MRQNYSMRRKIKLIKESTCWNEIKYKDIGRDEDRESKAKEERGKV